MELRCRKEKDSAVVQLKDWNKNVSDSMIIMKSFAANSSRDIKNVKLWNRPMKPNGKVYLKILKLIKLPDLIFYHFVFIHLKGSFTKICYNAVNI